MEEAEFLCTTTLLAIALVVRKSLELLGRGMKAARTPRQFHLLEIQSLQRSIDTVAVGTGYLVVEG